jgi:hypothetical protein
VSGKDGFQPVQDTKSKINYAKSIDFHIFALIMVIALPCLVMQLKRESGERPGLCPQL